MSEPEEFSKQVIFKRIKRYYYNKQKYLDELGKGNDNYSYKLDILKEWELIARTVWEVGLSVKEVAQAFSKFNNSIQEQNYKSMLGSEMYQWKKAKLTGERQ